MAFLLASRTFPHYIRPRIAHDKYQLEIIFQRLNFCLSCRVVFGSIYEADWLRFVPFSSSWFPIRFSIGTVGALPI